MPIPEMWARTKDARAELGVLLRLAGPIAVSQVGVVSMGLVDVAIVGRASVDDLAGLSIGRSILYAALSFGMGLTMALEPLASQAVGAREPDRAWAALVTTLRTTVLLLLPTAAAAFASTLLLEPLGVKSEIAARTRWYLVGHVPGAFGFVGYLAVKAFLQAHGRTRPAFVAAIVANLVNFLVCSVLVMGDRATELAGLPPIGFRGLGALGAGIATSIASLLMFALVLVPALSHRPATPPEPVAARTVWSLGSPIGLQLLAEIGVFSLVGVLAGKLGAEVVSAHQIAVGLASFSFMFALGVSGATSVRVGHAVGSRVSARRPGVLGLSLGAGVATIGAFAFALFPRPLISLFTDDAGVIDTGVMLLGIAALFQFFDCFQAVASGALRGAGDVRYPFVANVVAHWAIGFPLAVTLTFFAGMGARGLWIGLMAGLGVVSILLTRRFIAISRNIIDRVG